MMNVLFLCTGNSCRSLIAEAVFNQLAPAGWRALSAGSQPTGKLNERALRLLADKGVPTAGYFSKSWDKLPVTPDIVVTVCAGAAGDTCPAYLGPVLRTHWGVEDPSQLIGSAAEVDAAFETAYAILRARIDAFLALPLDELKMDRARFKAALDDIGHIGAHQHITPT
jgi:arsenate reductase